MQLTDARDELAARGFDGLTPSRANFFLNTAKEVLENFAPWPWLEASTSGVSPLTITNLATVVYVYKVNPSYALDGQQRSYLRQMYGPDLTITGLARFWYLTGLTTLTVFPVDTSTIYVDYIVSSPELVNDTDEPMFPSRLDQIWIDLACVEAYNDADEPSMSATLKAKSDQRLQNELDTYFDRNHQNPDLQPLNFASEDW